MAVKQDQQQVSIAAELLSVGRQSGLKASAVASTRAQQRADALLRLITEGPAKVETEVIVHVRADGCSLDDSSPVSATRSYLSVG